MTAALLAGFFTGLSLIVAIGAQNAYVLRMGLSRHHVGLIVFICTLSDLLLIIAGIGGIGSIVQHAPQALNVLRWFGVAYLALFTLRAFKSALKSDALEPNGTTPPSLRSVVTTTIALTWLNPHVYIDTVVLLGSIGNQWGHHRWAFALGASFASILWFAAIGFGAKIASPYLVKARTWQIVDVAIGLVMIGVAVKLATTSIPH